MAAGSAIHDTAVSRLAADDAGVVRALGSTAGGHLYATETPTAEVDRDATLNDSDKTVTVPANELWHVIAISATLTTTATVGNRLMRLEVRDDSANVLLRLTAGAVQAASLTYVYNWLPGVERGGAAVDNSLNIALPPQLYLPAGWDMRIVDIAAVDAAADDLTTAVIHRTLAV